MRFVTFATSSGPRCGVVDGDVVRALPSGVSLLTLLQAGDEALHLAGSDALRGAGKRGGSGGSFALDEIDLLAPVTEPPTVRDFMTFESHFAGARGPDNPIPPEWYSAPAFYFSNPYAVIGPSELVPFPPRCQLFDLELEVGAVIGRRGADVPVEEADEHIAGYTLLVDWSARDLQIAEMQVGLGPTKGKDTATTLGPALVTADELEPFRSGTSFALEMVASINGRELGRDRLDSMAFSFADMVSYASRGTEVRPGDVLGSGTCGGGCLAEFWGRYGFDGYPPLEPGDRVTVEVERLGSMTLEVGPRS
jgi:2-keto-4-pentenoate hydratase/2-oxohepta-3-ene-1,7-dioic acid hydratase in catechol pathway